MYGNNVGNFAHEQIWFSFHGNCEFKHGANGKTCLLWYKIRFTEKVLCRIVFCTKASLLLIRPVCYALFYWIKKY